MRNTIQRIVEYLQLRKSADVPVTLDSITKVARIGPLDIDKFNEKFVAANQALTGGNTEALKSGIGLFIDALPVAGHFTPRLVMVIQILRCALTKHDRADTKGPWNRDLSGYGLFAWKNDLYDRDAALGKSWEHISSINNELKSMGLGWKY